MPEMPSRLHQHACPRMKIACKVDRDRDRVFTVSAAPNPAKKYSKKILNHNGC